MDREVVSVIQRSIEASFNQVMRVSYGEPKPAVHVIPGVPGYIGCNVCDTIRPASLRCEREGCPKNAERAKPVGFVNLSTIT